MTRRLFSTAGTALFCASIVSAVPVLAEDMPRGAETLDRGHDFHMMQPESRPGVQNLQERVQEKRPELRARLQEATTQRVQAFFARLVRRLQAAINRLTQLTNRIEQRLDVLASEGHDMTNNRAMLTDARTNIQAAQTTLNEAMTAFVAVQDTDQPRVVFLAVRGMVQKIVRNLKEAHTTLTQIITTIKGLRVGTLPSPSPSLPAGI
jgi:chromosome segregation ATPase